MIRVLLYYHFADVKNPQKLQEEMLEFCKQNKLTGRILVSHQGINGTCAGTKEKTTQYEQWLKKQPGFENIWFKEQFFEENPFKKMFVRHKKELVTYRRKFKLNQAKHIDPKEVNELAKNNDVVFFDTRNEIESRIGKFKGAISPDIKYFRDLPKKLNEYAKELKGKKVIIYCTGGIRCEIAGDVFAQHGIETYQINGGIYNYCTQFPNALFQGTCYVFDERMQVGWKSDGSTTNHTQMPKERLISQCEFCETKTSRVVNDERHLDRVLRVCCEKCDKELDISRLRTKEERIKLRNHEASLKTSV